MYFFSIFISTILITRVFLYLKPTPAPTIKGFRIHHYMYGLILILFGVMLSNIFVYAVGWGLFIDELPFLALGGKTHQDNYSPRSLLGVLILAIMVMLFRNYLQFFGLFH